MKKGQMLKFLFYTILALVIFIPIAMFGAKFFKISDKAKDSFNSLANILGSAENPLRDREIASRGVYMDTRSTIVGFSKDSGRFELHENPYGASDTDKIILTFERPKECEIGKTCICLCRDIESEVTGSYEWSKRCKNTICKSFDNIDLLPKQLVYKYKGEQYYWKGGFLYFRNVPNMGNGLPINEIATQTFYIERYKNLVNICLESPCFSPEIKVQVDKKEAEESFNSFIAKYEGCRAKGDGTCGDSNLKAIALHYIYYSDSKNAKNGFYLMKGDYPKSFGEMEIVKKEDGSEFFYSGMLYKDEVNEFPTGNIFEGYGSELKVKGSKVILKIITQFST